MERRITFREFLDLLPSDLMVGVIEQGNGRTVSVSMFVDDWYDVIHNYGDRYVVMIRDVKAREIVKAYEINVILAAQEGEAHENA